MLDEAIKALKSEPAETQRKHISDPAQIPEASNFAVPALVWNYGTEVRAAAKVY